MALGYSFLGVAENFSHSLIADTYRIVSSYVKKKKKICKKMVLYNCHVDFSNWESLLLSSL